MVNHTKKNTKTLSDKQIRKMVEYFGGEDKLPDPTNYPKSFLYYVELFKYLRER